MKTTFTALEEGQLARCGFRFGVCRTFRERADDAKPVSGAAVADRFARHQGMPHVTLHDLQNRRLHGERGYAGVERRRLLLRWIIALVESFNAESR
jgi:hypothetical protein